MDWFDFWEHVSTCPECKAIVHDASLEEHREWHEKLRLALEGSAADAGR